LRFMFTTACRFFPLVRNGDTFSKVPLSDLLDRHLWAELHSTALDNAELVAVEGHDYPAHPDAYFPLVRFYQDSCLNPVAFLGARMFEQLHVDFKWSLMDYLKNIDAARLSVTTTYSGIALRVKPLKPEVWFLGWREEILEIRVDLTWRTPTGEWARAPWREAHRKEFIKAITSREWHSCFSRGMPVPYEPKNGWEEPNKPFEPDPALSADIIATINGIARPGRLRL
jgi:hypothetical protein